MKERFIKIVFILVTWGIELFVFQRWFSCWLFKDNFYFTSQDLTTHLANDIYADQGVPVLFVRILHNKFFELIWGILQAILQYWDIRFLDEFVGVAGAFGIGLGVWYLITSDRKNKLIWGILGIGIILSTFSTLFKQNIKYSMLLILFGIIFQGLSLYGIGKFLSKSSWVKYCILGVLWIISLLFIFLFPLFYQNFCVKI